MSLQSLAEGQWGLQCSGLPGQRIQPPRLCLPPAPCCGGLEALAHPCLPLPPSLARVCCTWGWAFRSVRATLEQQAAKLSHPSASPPSTPCAQLHLGVDCKGCQFKLEQQAANEATFRCPDQSGWQPQRQLVDDHPGLTLASRLLTDLDVGGLAGAPGSGGSWGQMRSACALGLAARQEARRCRALPPGPSRHPCSRPARRGGHCGCWLRAACLCVGLSLA